MQTTVKHEYFDFFLIEILLKKIHWNFDFKTLTHAHSVQIAAAVRG